MFRFPILIALLLVLCSCKNKVTYEFSEPAYKQGDDPAWAGKGLSLKGWNQERGQTGTQVFWLRTDISLNRSATTEHLGILIHNFGAFEVFWDGHKIGENGKVSGSTAELPGIVTTCFLIPDSLATNGSHLLALRTSQSYEQHTQRRLGLRIQSYSSILQEPLIIMSFMNLMAGAFLIAAVYYFFLFINSNRKEYAILICCITCFLFFALLIVEYIKFYIAIPYTRFYLRLETIGWLTFAISLLVPLYFTIQFSFKRRGFLMGILLLVLLCIYVSHFREYDLTAIYFSYAMWFASFAVVINALVQKEKGAGIVLAGLLLSAIGNFFLYYDFGLFISFTIIVLCMLYLQAIRTREVEMAHQTSLLVSARLKLELLKKHIQPHFIKNTLTSLIDWVEESPKEGALFVQALAAEFDILNQISDATLVAVSKEIELCEVHLKVMQFRKEIRYDWTSSNIELSDMIPPAIIHTALENGITHSAPPEDGIIRFNLSFERGKGYKKYTLTTTAKNRPMRKDSPSGTGFQYIQARLTESYGTRWEFDSRSLTNGWQTEIKIYTPE
ncbi:histidine kinase [Pedobacter caeni]|uniref:Histidine kinase n=1 Tax=Pedobacter caeni TaxID=288992 RepID=A0A1M4V5Q9_9SPHI|nr:histidine kinase [Pedobacter caeni]SHE64316.1 Histidine kinase [Pedobacter caeni]